MRHPMRLLPALLLAALAAAPAHATEWKSWNAGMKDAQASGRFVLVDVYTDWCGWCKRMDRDVYAKPEVSRYLASRFVTIKLNAEAGELTTHKGRNYSARSLAASFDVSSYPTTIFFDASGNRLVNVPGYIEPERFLLLLRYIGDGHMARNERWEDYVKQAQGAR